MSAYGLKCTGLKCTVDPLGMSMCTALLASNVHVMVLGYLWGLSLQFCLNTSGSIRAGQGFLLHAQASCGAFQHLTKSRRYLLAYCSTKHGVGAS